MFRTAASEHPGTHDETDPKVNSSFSLLFDKSLFVSFRCKFPGAAIYESMVALPSIWAQVEQSESFVDKFVTDLHVKYEYIHVKRGEECLEKLRPTLSLLNQFIETFRKAMDEVFPAQVAIEWLETYFMKRYRAVKKRHDFIEKAVTEQKTWLPRPIPNLDKLELN